MPETWSCFGDINILSQRGRGSCMGQHAQIRLPKRPVDRSHHRANRNGSGTVPLRSHREVVGSYRNEWTQWNRCEHGQLERFWNRSGFKPVV